VAHIAYHSPVQLVAQLITRAHHAERIPTKPLDRKVHDARIRESEDAIKHCLFPLTYAVGTEL
jgi:hypothetical protein